MPRTLDHHIPMLVLPNCCIHSAYTFIVIKLCDICVYGIYLVPPLRNAHRRDRAPSSFVMRHVYYVRFGGWLCHVLIYIHTLTHLHMLVLSCTPLFSSSHCVQRTFAVFHSYPHISFIGARLSLYIHLSVTLDCK